MMSEPIEFTFIIAVDESIEPSYRVIGEILNEDGAMATVTAEFDSLEAAEGCYSAHEETAVKRDFRCISRNAIPKDEDSWITMSRWRSNK